MSIAVIRKALKGAMSCAAAMAIFSMNVMSAQAQTYKWLAGVQLASIEPAAGGWVWVRLKSGTINCADVGGPPGNDNLKLSPESPVVFNNDSFNRIYGTLLTALAANQIMDVRITGSSDGQWCLVERVRILTN